MKFYKCEHCGNIVTFVEDKGVPVMCCGQKMTELTANTTDAAQEKHVPVVEQDGDTVKVTVGSVEHPMLEEHFIQWVCLETEKGSQIKYLKPGAKPEAVFTLNDDRLVAVYEYCNLHGLWESRSIGRDVYRSCTGGPGASTDSSADQNSVSGMPLQAGHRR